MESYKLRFMDGLKIIEEMELLMNIEVWKPIKDFPNYQISNRSRVKNITSGKIVKQCINSHGYYHVKLTNMIKRYTCTVHRLVAEAFIDNSDNKICIDHINRDRLDNDIGNLRWASHTENNQNASKRKDNTSGISGVILNKKLNKWQVYININGKRQHGGCFIDKNEAIAKRKAMEIEYFGEFAPK